MAFGCPQKTVQSLRWNHHVLEGLAHCAPASLGSWLTVLHFLKCSTLPSVSEPSRTFPLWEFSVSHSLHGLFLLSLHFSLSQLLSQRGLSWFPDLNQSLKVAVLHGLLFFSLMALITVCNCIFICVSLASISQVDCKPHEDKDSVLFTAVYMVPSPVPGRQ